jgi:hypothetical protein
MFEVRWQSCDQYAPAQLALCREDYLEWLPGQVQRFIEKYKMFRQDNRAGRRVGGKILAVGYPVAAGLCRRWANIGLGIDGGIDYSDESRRLTEAFAAERGLRLHAVSVPQEYGETIPKMAQRTQRGRGKPCSVCGLSKRHIMNRVAREEGYDVLVTGHNLDDEAATLFGNTLNWMPGHLSRQWPVLEADLPGLVRKAKPLCRIYEREMPPTLCCAASNISMTSARTLKARSRSITRSYSTGWRRTARGLS